MAKKVVFVPNVRAQSSSGEWLQGKQSNLARTSLCWWVRPCFLASSPKEALEIIKAMTCGKSSISLRCCMMTGTGECWLLFKKVLDKSKAEDVWGAQVLKDLFEFSPSNNWTTSFRYVVKLRTRAPSFSFTTLPSLLHLPSVIAQAASPELPYLPRKLWGRVMGTRGF